MSFAAEKLMRSSRIESEKLAGMGIQSSTNLLWNPRTEKRPERRRIICQQQYLSTLRSISECAREQTVERENIILGRRRKKARKPCLLLALPLFARGGANVPRYGFGSFGA